MNRPNEITQQQAADIKRLFCDNFSYYMKSRNRSQVDLAKALGVTEATVSHWSTGRRLPRMNMVVKIAIWLGIEPHDLITERKDEEYYFDEETKATARAIHKAPGLALLFDAAKDVSPEDLQMVHQMLLRLKRKEDGDGFDGLDEIRDEDDFDR